MIEQIKAGTFKAPGKPVNAIVLNDQSDRLLDQDAYIQAIGKDEEGNYVGMELKEALYNLYEAEGSDDNKFYVFQATADRDHKSLEIKIIKLHPTVEGFSVDTYTFDHIVSDLDPSASYEEMKGSGVFTKISDTEFSLQQVVALKEGMDVYINGNKADGSTWNATTLWSIPNDSRQAVVKIAFGEEHIPTPDAIITFDAHVLKLTPAYFDKAEKNAEARGKKLLR